ncbi:ATP synthase A1 subunit C [Candidatus Woesearchaeota archaeon]|nr:ATP synthase A1 subunit C [Candidatus Woesearchaeota archaeon]
MATTEVMVIPRKVHLGTHPYTYARVSAMKSKLLRKEDYTKLLKMKVNEIAKFLQETEYKKEIDEMAVSFSGIDLIEASLNKNIIRAFDKLKRISEGDLKLLIDAYLHRKDIMNLKTIFRGKFTKTNPSYVELLLVPVGLLHKDYLLALLKKESIEDIAKTIRFIDLSQAVKAFKENNNLFEIENQLDRYYYNTLLAFTKCIPGQGTLFKAFLENEIDILNIKTILRLKREGITSKEIEHYLFFSGARLKKHDLLKLTNLPDLTAVIASLKKHGYAKLLDEGEEKLKKEKSLIDIEIHLNHYLLDRAALLLHQHPLSIDVILGYMFAKEVEIRNLKTLIKGKQLGLDEDFISRELVIHR